MVKVVAWYDNEVRLAQQPVYLCPLAASYHTMTPGYVHLCQPIWQLKGFLGLFISSEFLAAHYRD